MRIEVAPRDLLIAFANLGIGLGDANFEWCLANLDFGSAYLIHNNISMTKSVHYFELHVDGIDPMPE